MKEKTIIPRYYELEAFRRSVNLKIWSVIGFLGLTSILCIGLAFIVIMKPTPVIAFDSKGRPILFEDTISPRLKLEETRVEYFVEEFLNKYAGIDSANLDRDLMSALNMMTPRLREIAAADEEEVKRRARFKNMNIRTHFEGLEVKIAPYDAEKSQQLHLVAWGKMVFEPRIGVADAELAEWFFSQIVLQRVSISKVAIHGILIDYVHTSFFSSEDEMRIERLKRKS